MADSPFQEIAALLRREAECYRLDSVTRPELRAAASTLDRYAEVLADLPELADDGVGPRYRAACVHFAARLRALSLPLTETTEDTNG